MRILIKFRFSICVLSASFFSLFLSCKLGDKDPGKSFTDDGNKIEYTKDAVFPKYEGLELAVFSTPANFTMTSDIGDRYIRLAGELAGIKNEMRLNEEQKSDTERWYINPNDPSAIVNFNTRNGDLTFNSGMKAYLGNKSTPDLLKNEKAVEQAKTYLSKLEILYKPEELVQAHVGGVNLGVHEGDKTAIFEKFTTVRFDRQLDKIPVYGHSRIIVQMAEKGKLNTLIRQWTPLDRTVAKKEELLVTDSLKRQLEKAILSENRDAQKIRLESLQLVYFDAGLGTIEPAIHVIGKTVHAIKDKAGAPSTQEFAYDSVIPLLKAPRSRYPYSHANLEKRPNDVDNSDKVEPVRKSPDDLNKK